MMDHLGSPRIVTGPTGQVESRQKYLPFGELLDQTGIYTSSKGYTNHEQTDPSGMIYMQARFYMPWMGRFTSPDPARDQHFEDTQSWNIYSYVRNSPILSTDPTGMVDEDKDKNQEKQTGVQGNALTNAMTVTQDLTYLVANTANKTAAEYAQMTLKTSEGALTAALYLESTGRLAGAATNSNSTIVERSNALTALSQEMSLIGSTILNRAAYADAQGEAGKSANGLGTPGSGVMGVLGAKGQYEGFSMDSKGNLSLAPAQLGRLQAAMNAKGGSPEALQLSLAGATARYMLTTGSPFMPTTLNGREINSSVMAQRTLGTGGPGFSAISLREAGTKAGVKSVIPGSGNAFFVLQ
jgi:RHS repeat-associated protein